MSKKIAVIGGIDHGKTMLISAIGCVFGTEVRSFYKDECTVLRTETKVDYNGEEYLFFDYFEDEDYEENLTGNEDGAILVISGAYGPTYGTEEAIKLCEKLGIKIAAVFMSMCDMVDDEELIELTEFDVRDMLEENGIEDYEIIEGSARRAAIYGEEDSDIIKKLVKTVSENV